MCYSPEIVLRTWNIVSVSGTVTHVSHLLFMIRMRVCFEDVEHC